MSYVLLSLIILFLCYVMLFFVRKGHFQLKQLWRYIFWANVGSKFPLLLLTLVSLGHPQGTMCHNGSLLYYCYFLQTRHTVGYITSSYSLWIHIILEALSFWWSKQEEKTYTHLKVTFFELFWFVTVTL